MKNYKHVQCQGVNLFVEYGREGIDNRALTGVVTSGQLTVSDVEFQIVEACTGETSGIAKCVPATFHGVFYAKLFSSGRYMRYVVGVTGIRCNTVTFILKRDVRLNKVGFTVISCYWGNRTPMTPCDPRFKKQTETDQESARTFWRSHALVDDGTGYDRTTITPTPPPGWE